MSALQLDNLFIWSLIAFRKLEYLELIAIHIISQPAKSCSKSMTMYRSSKWIFTILKNKLLSLNSI